MGTERPLVAEGESAGIDLSRVAADGDVMASGEQRFICVTGAETAKLFFGEIGVVAGIAFLFGLFARLFAALSVLAAVKIYFVAFVGCSLLVWGLFPLAIGGTPVALVFGNLRLIREGGVSVRGDLATTGLLWLVSLTYSLFPLVFAEYLYFMVARSHYQPLPFHVAGIRVVRPV